MTNTNTNTEKTVRITKAMRFEDIALMVKGEPAKNGSTAEDIVAFCTHERKILANKNKSSGEKKLTPTQVANIGYKEMLKDYLSTHPNVTCAAIAKGIPEFNENNFTTSKVRALLRFLMQDGVVEREVVKDKAVFHLVTVE